jgi:eukaryotic-like serine/threonine-protein kinase
MSIPSELWKKWEGRVVDEKFHLRQWLGGSDHSAVFLAEHSGGNPQKSAIKLTPTEYLDVGAQLSAWAQAARLSHPHLIRLFEFGRCQIDGVPLLYVVMEYAEETLAEVLPLRALSATEVSEMLQPAAEVLSALHRVGFVHSRIKPSNVMAVDNQLKLSADGLRKIGERSDRRALGAYDAPEVTSAGLSPASDVWSLGMTLVAVLTQHEPKGTTADQRQVAVPENIPQPLRGIVQQCLQVELAQRCTVSDILRHFPAQPLHTQATVSANVDEAHSQARPKRWMVVPIVVAALFVVAWIGSKFIGHQPPTPTALATVQQAPADAPARQSPSPFSAKQSPVQQGVTRGSVLQRTMPEVSRGAQNTISGRIKISVQVAVDTSGNVSLAKLVSPGPSKYFASRALAAARQWRFIPPQVDGQSTASEWVLRFQFGRTSTQVFPSEIKP